MPTIFNESTRSKRFLCRVNETCGFLNSWYYITTSTSNIGGSTDFLTINIARGLDRSSFVVEDLTTSTSC